MTKNLNTICAAIALMAAAGCESGHNHASANAAWPAAPPAPTYTVELIPNPQLTPTSREGDNPQVVYSSNIVAVFLNTNGVNAAPANSPAPASHSATGQRH